MAEILVRAIDSPRFPRGAVVAVRPGGWQWGRLEAPPNFVVIEVPDALAQHLAGLDAPLYDSTGDLALKRRFRFAGPDVDLALGRGGRNAVLRSGLVLIDDQEARLWQP